MKYLAVLGYDCGCKYDSNYGFMKPLKFTADTEEDLEKKLEQYKKRKSTSRDEYQCTRASPVEILIFDETFKLVKKWVYTDQ